MRSPNMQECSGLRHADSISCMICMVVVADDMKHASFTCAVFSHVKCMRFQLVDSARNPVFWGSEPPSASLTTPFKIAGDARQDLHGCRSSQRRFRTSHFLGGICRQILIPNVAPKLSWMQRPVVWGFHQANRPPQRSIRHGERSASQ